MRTNMHVLASIEAAFNDSLKPEHFTNCTCEKCAEHDDLLRTRDRETLAIEDVGNICWEPISCCSPEGMAYYMPALARLALTEPTYDYGWYGDTLHIHLSLEGKDNAFLKYCNPNQREAIAEFLKYLNATFSKYEGRLTTTEDMEQTQVIWENVD